MKVRFFALLLLSSCSFQKEFWEISGYKYKVKREEYVLSDNMIRFENVRLFLGSEFKFGFDKKGLRGDSVLMETHVSIHSNVMTLKETYHYNLSVYDTIIKTYTIDDFGNFIRIDSTVYLNNEYEPTRIQLKKH